MQARPYRDRTDLARMRQLLMVGSQANIPASYMHPGCLDWATHYPPDEQANRRNPRLWERFDGDQPALEAWAREAGLVSATDRLLCERPFVIVLGALGVSVYDGPHDQSPHPPPLI